MKKADVNWDDRAGRPENVTDCEPFFTVDQIDLRRIIDGIHIQPDQRLILGMGPCRVGTKAQLFTMAASGYTAYEQPLKSAYRCLGQAMDPEPFEPTDKVFYAKETIGPYTPGESLFNPVPLLEQAMSNNWMAKQLELIILLRNPLDTWQSWISVWGDRLAEDTLFDHFKQAFRTTREIAEQAKEQGLSLRSFDYSLNKQPAEIYRCLFEELNLTRTPVVTDWQSEDIRRRLKDNFISFREPDTFLPDGIRDHALSSDGLHYQSYKTEDYERRDEIRSTVEPIYNNLLEQLP